MTAGGKKIAGTRAVFLNVAIHLRVKHPVRLHQAPFAALVKYVYAGDVLRSIFQLSFRWFSGSVLHRRVQFKIRRQVQRRQRMPRRELLRRSISLLPSLHQQTQQDDLQSRIRVLYGGECRNVPSFSFSLPCDIVSFSFRKECTGSICLAYGLESCQCIPGPNDPPTKACELCCRVPGENQPCLYVINHFPPYVYIYFFYRDKNKRIGDRCCA